MEDGFPSWNAQNKGLLSQVIQLKGKTKTSRKEKEGNKETGRIGKKSVNISNRTNWQKTVNQKKENRQKSRNLKLSSVNYSIYQPPPSLHQKPSGIQAMNTWLSSKQDLMSDVPALQTTSREQTESDRIAQRKKGWK